MKYCDLKTILRAHESNHPNEHLTAHIRFSSFGPECGQSYTEQQSTYVISNDNKAFLPNMGGYSIFGSCLDGTDPCLRLDGYIQEEHGGKDGWVIEDCCIIGYLLSSVNERTIFSPRLFFTQDAAIEAMLKDLCRQGSLEYEEVLKEFQKNSGEVSDCDFEATRNTAWLNAGATGNWDWSIQMIRIFSPTHMEFGAPEEEAAR